MFLDMVACAKEGKFEMPPYVDVLQVGLQLPFLHLKAVGKIVGKVILEDLIQHSSTVIELAKIAKLCVWIIVQWKY